MHMYTYSVHIVHVYTCMYRTAVADLRKRCTKVTNSLRATHSNMNYHCQGWGSWTSQLHHSLLLQYMEETALQNMSGT